MNKMNKTNKWNIRLGKLRWRTRDTTKQSINITFFRCYIAPEQPTDRSTCAVHCIAVISFMPLCFRGPVVFIFTYFSFFCSKMHTVCSVFVFKSRLFYGFCCTSTKSCAYVDVTLVKKHGKNTIVLRLLFVYLNSNVLCLLKEREKMKIHTTNSNREISFEYRGVAHND